ncbi:MAG: hypothetical protein WCR72_06415 [Bacteroidota bacterium]
MKKIGIVIFLLGLGLTIFTTITYFSNVQVLKIGKIQIPMNESTDLRWSPLTGMAIMGIGGIVFWQTYNKL